MATTLIFGSGRRPMLPKTGQTISYADGDDGYYEAGQAYPATRWVDLGNGMVYDAHTDLTWCKDLKLVIPGGTGVLASGCVRGAWTWTFGATAWDPTSVPGSTVITLSDTTGLRASGMLYINLVTTESGAIIDGNYAYTLSGSDITIAYDAVADGKDGDTFDVGLAGNHYVAGDLVQSPTDSAFYICIEDHYATTDPGSYTGDGWVLQPFIASASAPFTIAQATMNWTDTLAAIANLGTWNGIPCGTADPGAWRLPNVFEEALLYNSESVSQPYVPSLMQPGTLVKTYWTSTPGRPAGWTWSHYVNWNSYGLSVGMNVKTTATYYAHMVRTGRP